MYGTDVGRPTGVSGSWDNAVMHFNMVGQGAKTRRNRIESVPSYFQRRALAAFGELPWESYNTEL